MVAHRKYSGAMRAECEEVAERRDAIPSDNEIALKHGSSAAGVRRLMEAYRKRGKKSISRGTTEEVVDEAMREMGLDG